MLSPLPVPTTDAHNPVGHVPRILQDRIVGMVIAAFYAVHRELGYGYGASVYQRALALEFLTRRLNFEQDSVTSVFYKGTRVGHHRAPFVVEGRVMVDIGVTPSLDMTAVQNFEQSVQAVQCDAALFLHFGRAAAFRHIDRAARDEIHRSVGLGGAG